jgi:ABC-type Na+ efflux pump permease subunit
MIIGWIRLAVFAFLGLSVLYLLVSVYSRSVRREKLEKRFDAGGVEGDRDTYIADGMTAYEKGLRKRLIWLVYIIPMIVFSIIIYFVN